MSSSSSAPDTAPASALPEQSNQQGGPDAGFNTPTTAPTPTPPASTAQPSPSAVSLAHSAHSSRSAPPYPAQSPSTPSLVPPYLTRLTRILTLLLALGGSAALISTYLILPLLQSTFAARTALIKAQSERMQGFVSRLRAMRGLEMYRPREKRGEGKARGQEGEASEKRREKVDGEEPYEVQEQDVEDANEKDQEYAPPTSGTSPSSDSQLQSTAGSATPKQQPLIPFTTLLTLISHLRTLSHTRSNTSTTRTSLLSTIEAYTSSLHRQLWNPAPGHSAYGFASGSGVGLGSLDQQLAETKGRGKGKGKGSGDGYDAQGWSAFESANRQGQQFEDVLDRTEEWDAVRREVRGVKGLLLGRRTFARPT